MFFLAAISDEFLDGKALIGVGGKLEVFDNFPDVLFGFPFAGYLCFDGVAFH